MKRWILALVALSGITAGLARADYLILIINVSQSRMSTPASGSGAGAQGQVGAGQLGQAGIQGGAGQVGLTGQGGLGNRGTQSSPQPVPKLIHVVVEVKDMSPAAAAQFNSGSQPARLQHKWGTASLVRKTGPLELAAVYMVPDKSKYFPSVAKRFDMEVAKVAKEKTADNTLKLAEWALSHGMNKKFDDIMEGLVKDDKDNPKLQNYQKIKAELAKRVDKSPPAAWFERLAKGYKRDDSRPHYTLLHNLSDGEQSEINSRLTHLEDHLKGYYHWWALHGTMLPMPKERLVAVLAGSSDEFKHFHRGLSGGPIHSDSFQSPRENLVVLALYPQGDKYDMLNKYADQYFRKPETSRANALQGKFRGLTEETVQASAMALALRSMEDAMERASISHQGTRQLLYASELLPRNVEIPQWMLFGLGSVFETPVESPWQTLGAPSNLHLPRVRELFRGGKLESTALGTLKMVVTDGYFRGGAATAGKAEPTAWSLCYFLARKEPAKLMAYFKQLARMPRDIDLDNDILLGCFARAFDAWDSNTNSVINPKLQNLALNWFNDMKAIELEGDEWAQDLKRAIAAEEKRLMPSRQSGSGNSRPGVVGPGVVAPGPGY